VTHLGTQVSALADGQLGPAAAERALAHVAACAECAAELDAARAARRAIAAAFEVRPTADLTARLLALGAGAPAPAPADDDRRSLPSVGSVPLPGTSQRLPSGCLRGDLPRRRPVPWRSLAAAGAGLGLAVVGLYGLGAQATVTAQRHPAHVLTVLGRAGAAVAAQGAAAGQQADEAAAGPRATLLVGEGAATGPFASVLTVTAAGASAAVVGDAATGAQDHDGGAPAGARDPADAVAAWLEEHPWAAPVVVPDGYAVAAVREDPDGYDGLEVDLVGPSGLIVLTQTHGCLDRAPLPEPVLVAERAVHVLSSAPWHAVWQSGDAVVSVAAEVSSWAAQDVVGSYPAQAYDDGVPARIARGWQVLAGVWSGS